MQVRLSNQIVGVCNFLLASRVKIGAGTLEVGLLDDVARLLDHDHTVVDQVAELHGF